MKRTISHVAVMVTLCLGFLPCSVRAQFGPPGGKRALDKATDRTPEDPAKRRPWLENRIAAMSKTVEGTADDSPAKPDLLLKLATMHRDLADTCVVLRDLGISDEMPLPDKTLKELAGCIETHGRKAADVVAGGVEKFPKHAAMDEMLFYLGWFRVQHQDTKGAVAAATRLVKEHPESGYVPEAYLLLGEVLFEAQTPEQARTAYQQAAISQAKSNKVRLYALYKLAWCDYNLSNFTDALQGFVTVVKEAGKSQEWKHLRREALRDTVLAYAAIGKPDRAVEFYTQLAPDEAQTLLLPLAELWLDQARLKEVRSLCKALREAFPESRKLLEAVGEIEVQAGKLGK